MQVIPIRKIEDRSRNQYGYSKCFVKTEDQRTGPYGECKIAGKMLRKLQFRMSQVMKDALNNKKGFFRDIQAKGKKWITTSNP